MTKYKIFYFANSTGNHSAGFMTPKGNRFSFSISIGTLKSLRLT